MSIITILAISFIVLAIIGGGIFYFMHANSKESQNLETSNNLIETAKNPTQSQEPAEVEFDLSCDAFADKLDSCTKYKCQFIHPFTNEPMEKEILGIIDGTCNYIEQMPNSGKMECKYTESMRKAIVKYYQDLAASGSAGTEVHTDLGSGNTKTKYTIDGKEVSNPLDEAMTNGQCVISGY